MANVEAVREDVIAERKRLEKQDKSKGKEGSKTELVPLEEEITKAVMKHFAEQEMVRTLGCLFCYYFRCRFIELSMTIISHIEWCIGEPWYSSIV